LMVSRGSITIKGNETEDVDSLAMMGMGPQKDKEIQNEWDAWKMNQDAIQGYDSGGNPRAQLTNQGRIKLSGQGDIEGLGSMAYEDVVELAKLGQTIIEGGYIKSDLLTADNIVVGDLDADKTNIIADAGSTKINRDGIQINNGKLLLKNQSGNVVIDGTSNMFKILLSGTAKISAEGSVTINFPDLGYRPACLAYLQGTNDQVANRSIMGYYVMQNDGQDSWGIWAHTSSNDIRIDNFYSWSLDVRYYVLKEAGI